MERINRVPSFKNITTTYVGKSGCACGCGGNYAAPLHAAAEHNAEWTPRNDRTVKMRLNRLVKAMTLYPDQIRHMGFGDEEMWEYEYGEFDRNGDCRVLRVYAVVE